MHMEGCELWILDFCLKSKQEEEKFDVTMPAWMKI